MSMILLAGLLAAAPVPPEAKVAPRVLTASLDGNRLVCEVPTRVTTQVPVVSQNGNDVAVVQYINVEQEVNVLEAYDLKGATFSTVGGERLDRKVAEKRLATKAKVVVSGNAKPVDPSYLKGLDKDVVVVVAPGEPKKVPAPPTPVELEM